MKIYIAAPWADRELARQYAKRWEDIGVEITHNWWDYDFPESQHEQMRQCAKDDLNAVMKADVMVLLNTQKSEGKAVEQGIAIMAGVPIVAVGKLGEVSKNVFHYLDCYTWVDDTEQAFDAALWLYRQALEMGAIV